MRKWWEDIKYKFWNWVIKGEIDVTVTHHHWSARVEAYHLLFGKKKVKIKEIPDFVEMIDGEPDFGQIQEWMKKHHIRHVKIEWRERALRDALQEKIDKGGMVY